MSIRRFNYIQKLVVCFVLLQLCLVPKAVIAHEQIGIDASQISLQFEDEKIPVNVYTINERDYVPFTAIANYFGIAASLQGEQIILTMDDAIDPEKEFYDFLSENPHTVLQSPHTMAFYGDEITVSDLLLVDGYNFIPLEEIGPFFGCETVYDKIPNTIVLTNDYYYTLSNEELERYSQSLKDSAIGFSLDDLSPLTEIIDFSVYNVYLIGENHAVGKNRDVEMAFIKYLNGQQGLRHVLVELGYCDSIALNAYLETGDEAIIEKRLESVAGTFSYTKENFNHYKDLYEYNQTLPEDSRIRLIGIDVQHNWRDGLNVINQYFNLNDDTRPEVMNNILDLIEKEDLSPEDVSAALDLLHENAESIGAYLGESYQDFYYGLRSIWQSMAFYQENDFDLRELFIHDNISDVFNEMGVSRCFGMLGGAHTMLDGVMSTEKGLANFLNTEFSPTKNKVLSMMCIYNDSYYMNRYTGESEPCQANFGELLNRMVDDAVSGEYGLCASGDIPFGDGLLSDMFQYMLCVKNSPAAQPHGVINR